MDAFGLARRPWIGQRRRTIKYEGEVHPIDFASPPPVVLAAHRIQGAVRANFDPRRFGRPHSDRIHVTSLARSATGNFASKDSISIFPDSMTQSVNGLRQRPSGISITVPSHVSRLATRRGTIVITSLPR